MTKQKLIEKLAQEIIENKVCVELAAGATQLVMGEGNPDAEIVFIGEAPGKQEDLQGRPFVGASGKFLDEMIASIGLQRSDVYITNIVKYRPPNNRDPLPQEKKEFRKYLDQQLAIIKPKLIVTLGRHSGMEFWPSLKISRDHGRPKRIAMRFGREQVTDSSQQRDKTLQQQRRAGGLGSDGVQGDGEQRTESYKRYDEGAAQPGTQQSAENLAGATGSASRQGKVTQVILPLYHPAAALYNGSQRQILLDDFAKIPRVLELINNEI